MMAQRYRRREDLVTREIAGETLLVPVRGDLAMLQRIFLLNPVGEYVWRCMDGDRDLEAISKEVMAHFDVEETEATTDLRDFVAALRDAALIVEVA